MIVAEDNPKIPTKTRIANSSIVTYLNKSVKTGELPYVIFLLVGLYNIIVFEIPAGYGIYTVLPFGIGILMYYVKMWTRSSTYRLTGKIILIILLLYDFLLSILFIQEATTGLQSYQSIPTAILDLIGLYLLLTQKVTVEASPKKKEKT